MERPAEDPQPNESPSTWMATRGREIHLEALDLVIRRLSHPTGIPEVDAALGVDPGRITPEATLEGDLGLDSLGVVELLMALEDSFGLAISDEEAGRMVTVGDVAALVVGKKLAEETGHRPGE